MADAVTGEKQGRAGKNTKTHLEHVVSMQGAQRETFMEHNFGLIKPWLKHAVCAKCPMNSI